MNTTPAKYTFCATHKTVDGSTQVHGPFKSQPDALLWCVKRNANPEILPEFHAKVDLLWQP